MTTKVKAGMLDRRITIEQYTVTRNSIGEEVKTWVTWIENLPAAKAMQDVNRQEEKVGESALFLESLFVFTIRHVNGTPNARMRVKEIEGGITYYYDVERVEPIGRRKGYNLKTRIKDVSNFL